MSLHMKIDLDPSNPSEEYVSEDVNPIVSLKLKFILWFRRASTFKVLFGLLIEDFHFSSFLQLGTLADLKLAEICFKKLLFYSN